MSGFFLVFPLVGLSALSTPKKAWDTAATPNANPAPIQHFTKTRQNRDDPQK
jgi:hypothetical protein